jgi:hypothetical protein
LEPGQVKSIEILLRKVLPDMARVDATIEHDLVNHVISAEPMTEEEFIAKYGVEPADGSSQKH